MGVKQGFFELFWINYPQKINGGRIRGPKYLY